VANRSPSKAAERHDGGRSENNTHKNEQFAASKKLPKNRGRCNPFSPKK
jgi:hypothetical protein